jgi:nucleotide-binding universal stress UspA family protein
MDSHKHTILVPTDFTVIADYAAEHAVKFSKLLKKDITFLHIIKKDMDFQEAEKQIVAQADALFQKHGIRPQTLVREGSIFSAIGEVANELNAEVVIMGTHGRKGFQKFTGMWALKVIVKAKAPFLVVHDYPQSNLIEKIVFTIDFKKENMEKIRWATLLADLFKSKVYLFKSTSKVNFLGLIRFNDKGFLRNIFFNTKTAEKYLKNNNISYEIVQAPQSSKTFAEETIDFSRKIKADLILITTTKSIDISDYILGASEQIIIDNEAKIPVLCINPRPTRVGSFSASGG